MGFFCVLCSHQQGRAETGEGHLALLGRGDYMQGAQADRKGARYTEPDLVKGLTLKHQRLRLLIKEQEANGINMYLSVFTDRWVLEDWHL